MGFPCQVWQSRRSEEVQGPTCRKRILPEIWNRLRWSQLLIFLCTYTTCLRSWTENADSSDGRSHGIPQRWSQRRNLHEAATWIWNTRKRRACMQAKEIPLWVEAITTMLEWEVVQSSQTAWLVLIPVYSFATAKGDKKSLLSMWMTSFCLLRHPLR